MQISWNLYRFKCYWLDEPSSGSLLQLHDSYNLHRLKCVFFCIPYFRIRPFGIFEVNTGRVRSPSPSCRTSKIPYWRGGVEMSILKNKETCLKTGVCWAAVSNVVEYISSKHLIPSRYCAGRMVKHSGHQWICPASASENGRLPPLSCPLAAACMQYIIKQNGENVRLINRGWN